MEHNDNQNTLLVIEKKETFFLENGLKRIHVFNLRVMFGNSLKGVDFDRCSFINESRLSKFTFVPFIDIC